MQPPTSSADHGQPVASKGAGGLLIRPRFWAQLLLFLSIATVSLGAYEISLPGGLTLTLMRAVLLAAIGVRVLVGTTRRSLRYPRVPRPAVAYGAFLVYSAISFLALSKWNEQTLSVLVAKGFGLIYALWLPQVIRNRRQLRLVLAGIICANSLVIPYAVYQFTAWFTGFGMRGYAFTVPFASLLLGSNSAGYLVRPSRIGGLFRLTLPSSSSTHLGTSVAVLMLSTMPLLAYPSLPRRARRWLVMYDALMFLLLVATFSRGAWVGWATGLLCIVVYHRRKLMVRRIALFLLVVAFLGALASILQPGLPVAVMSRLDAAEVESSDQTRLAFFKLAAEMFFRRPLLGNGLGSYRLVTGIAHPHNSYLHVLAELGILGAGLMLLWVSLVLWYGHRAVTRSAGSDLEHYVALGLLAAFVSILVNNMVQESFYFSSTLLIPGLLGSVHCMVADSRRLPKTT